MFNKRAIQGYIAAIALFITAGAILYFYKPAPSLVLEPAPVVQVFKDDLVSTTSEDMPASLVMVFATTPTSTLTDNRDWPTKHIWLRQGNGEAELLGETGKVGEYPAALVLSPAHNSVAVNLEKAVDVIDLQTKEKKRVFSDGKWVIGVAYSQDGNSLIVADGATFAGDDIAKPIYSVSLKTGVATTLIPDMKVLNQGEIDPQILRKDNVLLFYPVSYKDCGSSRLYSLDLATKVATSTYERFGVSDDGMLAIGAAIETVDNPPQNMGMCSDAVLPSIVPVVEPLSGQVLGVAGKVGEPFTLVAFSPDHTQVLFKTSTDLKNYTYYLQKIGNGATPAVVSDPNTILFSWKASTGPVTYAQEGQNYNALYVGNTPIVTSSQWPTLIGQYFR